MKEAEEIYQQARRYLQGDSVPQSHEKGVAYLKQAADLGHAKAQYNLGICLHEGMGVRQSYEEAVRYFLIAAEQGHPRANYMLGCYLAFGFLGAISEERAIPYFRLAADAGVADAQYNLGVLLLNRGEESADEAARYFTLAAEEGHADAQYNLGVCYSQGLGVPASREEAIRYLELALRQHQPKAAETLEQVLMNIQQPKGQL